MHKYALKSAKDQFKNSWRLRDAIGTNIKNINNLSSYLQYPHSSNYAYLDSVASNNFGNEKTLLVNITKMKNAMPMRLTNGQLMTPAHSGTLQHLPSISQSSKECQISTSQQGPSLVSIGKLCNDGCIAVADSKKRITHKNKPVIKEPRCSTTGMHVIDLNNPLQTRPIVHANLQQFISLEQMKFLYGSLGSQPLSTIRRGLTAGYLDSFPDLTAQNISKLSPSNITIFGHLDTKQKITNQPN